MAKHIVQHTLHSRSGIYQSVSREDALAILKKWSTAIRHGKRGHRTIFLMHEKHGRLFDRLVIETRSHQMRRATEALADLKPEYSKSVEIGGAL